ncbi:superoxide dismutase family protein [Rhodohalobacter sp. 614A]|uniref:superoxide dismutase family protein n=1 Tax=Rhodohalobacter sp. 614A TaxID=2908649 RepID=UPI001F47F92B|nr:superoxide dismutase family protein [Rhodohalobacter sp. 614A]
MMRYLSLSLLTLFLLASCSQGEVSEMESDMDMGTDTTMSSQSSNGMVTDIETATAVLHPTEGNDVSGVVVFTQTDQGVQIQATVTGLEPDTRHGFHIHQYGDCRAADGTSAGGHYNPSGDDHGAPSDDARHMGDLGNLPVDAQGTASADFIDTHVELSSILGRGMILHAGEDDLTSQPTGAAGARLACGVIGIANPEVEITN